MITAANILPHLSNNACWSSLVDKLLPLNYQEILTKFVYHCQCNRIRFVK